MATLAALLGLAAASPSRAYNFNRTVYPINPGLKWWPKYATFVADAASDVSAQDPSHWSLLFDLSGQTERSETMSTPGLADDLYGTLSFRFNGSGVILYVTQAGPGQPSYPEWSVPRPTLSLGGRHVDMKNVTVDGTTTLVLSHENETTSEMWGWLELPYQSQWRIDNITYLNHTIQPANVSIPEMDDSMTVEMYENKTYSTNETWLQDVLSGGSGVAFKVENSSFGWVKDLPDNVTFVSVLGRKSMIPGDGGQCRFVFDPPLKSSGLFWRETGVLNYTFVDTGNPTFINVSYPGTYPDQNVTFANASALDGRDEWPSGQSSEVQNVHYLDQQLDPKIRYRMGIFNGPKAQDESGYAVVKGPPGHPERMSAYQCYADSIKVWKQVPDAGQPVDDSTTDSTNSTGSTDGSSSPDSAGATQERKSMSGGAIAGTVVGVVLGVLLLAAVTVWLVRRRRRHRYFSGDLDGDVHDDPPATPYVAPPGAPPDSKQPRPEPEPEPERPLVYQHEQDAGALPAEPADGNVVVLPPMYQEEWGAADLDPGSPGPSRPAGSPSVSSPGQDMTPEEIKFLGRPVTAGASSQASRGITAEEIKYLGPPSSSHSSERTHDAKFFDATSTPAAESERAPLSHEKGKGAMPGEQRTL